jgi:hypothetical protein
MQSPTTPFIQDSTGIGNRRHAARPLRGVFCRQRDFFATAICFGWLSTNLFYAGWYAADARAMAIPLLSPGGREVRHDWNYLLGAMGLLAWDQTIGFLFRAAASLSMLACLAAGGWLLGVMIRLRGTLRVPGPWE